MLSPAPDVFPLPDKARQVLEAACQIFLEHGYSAATTDMIQQAAGVSKSTVYAYYENKAVLFQAVIEEECARFTERVVAATSDAPDLAGLLLQLGQAYLSLVLSPRGLALYRVVVADAIRFPELGHCFYQAGPRAIQKVLAAHLGTPLAQEALDLEPIGAERAAGLFFSMLRGEAQLECLTHPALEESPSRAQINQWVELAVGTFLRAFGRSTARRTAP